MLLLCGMYLHLVSSTRLYKFPPKLTVNPATVRRIASGYLLGWLVIYLLVVACFCKQTAISKKDGHVGLFVWSFFCFFMFVCDLFTNFFSRTLGGFLAISQQSFECLKVFLSGIVQKNQ